MDNKELRLTRAVIPLSLKEPEQKIVSMAGLLRYFGTQQVFLVHVRTNNDKGKKQERLTDTIRAYALKLRELGFTVDMYFRRGHIASEILTLAAELEADFLSILWERKWALQKALLGSVEADILRMADHPVFVYKHPVFMAREQKINQVMYTTNFQITDRYVTPYLTNPDFVAQNLCILHVGQRAPDPQAEAERREMARQNLNRLKAQCEHAFQEVSTQDVVGQPKARILHAARRCGVDLLIIGKSDNQSAFEQIMGSTAQFIADKAACSVFIVPGEQRQ